MQNGAIVPETVKKLLIEQKKWKDEYQNGQLIFSEHFGTTKLKGLRF